MDPDIDNPTPDDLPDDVLNGAEDGDNEESLDDALAESLDRAIEEDSDDADDEPEDPPADEEGEPAAPEVKPDEGEPEAKKPEGDQPKAQPDADTEAEIASLGLKEKSAARFREMASEIKQLAPIRDQLKAAGVEDFAELPRVVQRAKDADDLVAMIGDTGATPDQYGQTLDYLKVANAAASGDPKAAEQALEMIMAEAAVWAKALGREIPGVHDPLAGHDDLAAAVEQGDMDRKHAVELAAARERSQTMQQHRQQATQQQQGEAVQQQARQQLVQWDQQMAQDPAYQAKRPMLDAMVRNIRATLPPDQWLAATQQAFASIPDVPTPAPRAPAPSPVRPGGPRGGLAPKKFESVEDALDFALDGPASR